MTESIKSLSLVGWVGNKGRKKGEELLGQKEYIKKKRKGKKNGDTGVLD